VAEYEIFFTGIVTSICGLIGLLLINRNWFKKQKFKYDLNFLGKEQKIRLKKLEKDLLGSAPVKEKSENIAPNLLTQIAPLLKGLDGEQIAALIESFTGEEEAPAPAAEGLGGLLNTIITENPELVQGFLQGIKQKTDNTPTAPQTY